MVDVADRVQPLAADDPEAVVDVEPGARFQADRLEADVLGARRAAGGEEDLVGLDAVTGVGEGDHGRALARDRGHRGAGAHVRARLRQGLGHQLPGEGLHAGQQALAADQEGDLGAEGLPGRGHLGGDHAAAHHDQPSGHLVRAGGLAARPGFDLCEPRQIGELGARAGADGDRVPGGQHPADAVGPVDRHGA